MRESRKKLTRRRHATDVKPENVARTNSPPAIGIVFSWMPR